MLKINRKSPRGLIAIEWVAFAYLVLTTVLLLFTFGKHDNIMQVLGLRVQILAMMVGLWLVHYLFPCKATLFARTILQAALLSVWYPDTYEVNKVFTNLDPTFAAADQALFGFQPALSFSQHVPDWIGELLYMGYWSYYVMIAYVFVYFLLFQRKDFQRAGFITLSAFFAFYVIFVLVPVAGPTYYYDAVGVDNIVRGIFPAVGDHFQHSQDCLPAPGDSHGLFYQLVEQARIAGERPTAAFPSSHVGCSTVIMLIAFNSKHRWVAAFLAPFYVLLCLATVYNQAHYAVDAICGLFVGAAFYFLFNYLYKRIER